MGKGALKFYLDATATDGWRTPVTWRCTRPPTQLLSHRLLILRIAATPVAAAPQRYCQQERCRRATQAVFVSDPLKHSQEFSGLFSGKLDFTVNKQDVDLTIALYELLPSRRSMCSLYRSDVRIAGELCA